MAFNRNMNLQRSNNSNNSNNRMGNMTNNRMAGRIGSVSPWESGVMPGRGILPTPNNNLNINSLSSPQTTLALASNLISNLLRQQEPQSQQVPPSLLSLGSSFNAPVANYNNQQNYNQGRFNDRLGRQNMKNQRPQPYNKMGNRARDGNAGRRNQQQSRNQSGNQRQNGNQRNDRSSKPNTASKLTQNIKKEQDKTSDKHDKNDEKAEAPVALSEENDETEESKKREWKDEKKERTSDKKDGAIKTEDTSDKDESENSKKTSTRHAESRYADVPTSNMTCHVCNKHMWDGFSFENHLRGRAHLLMMDKLDESYKLKVELMRHELRVAEEARELTLTNSKRRGKRLSVDMSVREYCTMCDLRFLGPLSNHRKGEKHQQLKTFLHPRCAPCNKEFPSRIEYDEHCLTPGHMKNAVQAEEAKQKRKKDKLIKGEFDVRTAEEEEKDVGTEKVDKADEPTGDAQDFVTDIPEVIEAKLKIPSYKHCRVHQLPVGRSLVKECTGYYCDRCRRFMITEEDMMAHLRSVTHYRNYIQEIKTLQAAAAATAAAAEKTNENKDKEVDKDVSQETSEPDAKRPKLENTADVEVKEESKETDKYDPEQANESEEEDNQDGQNDNEEAITLNETDDILDEANENDEHDEVDENDDQEDEDEEKEEPPKKTAPSTTRSRGGASPRVRGNRARRSRR